MILGFGIAIPNAYIWPSNPKKIMPKPDHITRTEMLELQKRLFSRQNEVNSRLTEITDFEEDLHSEKAKLVAEMKTYRPNNLTWLRNFFGIKK